MLIALGKRLQARADDSLRAEGLSLRHLSALGHLQRNPGLSYSDLARRAGITAQSMQATLSQLETQGAIERLSEPGRGRPATLRVTSAGEALIQAGREVVREADKRIIHAVGEEYADDLTDILLRMTAATGITSKPPAL
jgi:DNA-binding MarR family transcriptional regulator